MRERIFPFVLLLFLPAFGGKYVAEFLEVGTGVRAAGLGGAYCAFGTDASAVWWNPAAVAWQDAPQIYAMHSALYGNIYQLDAIAYRDKFRGVRFCASAMRLGTDQIPFTRDDGFYDYGTDGVPGTGDEGEGNGVWDPGEPVDASAIQMRSEGDYVLVLSAATPLSKRLAWGASAKFLHQRIGDYTNFGFGADVGIRYRLSERLFCGLSVLDVTGTHISWSTGFSESKLPSVRVGASYALPLRERAVELAVTSELELRFEGGSKDALISVDPVTLYPHLGVEARFWEHFFARVGVDRRDFCAGAGIKISRFTLDYAFVASSIDQVHRVALTVDFNPRLPPGIQKPE